MEILVRHPQCLPVARRAIAAEQLAFEPCREIYKTMFRLADAGDSPTFGRLMLEFDHPAVKNLLVELDENGAAKAVDDPQALLEELIKSFFDQETVKLALLRQGCSAMDGWTRVSRWIFSGKSSKKNGPGMAFPSSRMGRTVHRVDRSHTRPLSTGGVPAGSRSRSSCYP